MFGVILDAFCEQRSDLMLEMGIRNEHVQHLESLVRAELIEQAKHTPSQLDVYIEVLDVVHTLERVADRTTNIAQRVGYLWGVQEDIVLPHSGSGREHSELAVNFLFRK
jgi:phosphate transport system protein